MMSKGIGAHANLVFKDENTVIYEYGGYNLNKEQYKNEDNVCDGKIIIEKSCFNVASTHKQTHGSINYDNLIQEGLIQIENCSNCWLVLNAGEKQIDIMATHILFKLFSCYSKEGEIPACISYNV